MKWFKHLSNSMDDEKIASLICQHGMEMYGYWWAVLEIVARQVGKDSKCSVAYPIAHWSRLLYTTYQRAGNVLLNLEATGLLQLSKEESIYKVTIPNLLKYRDEYSKKSGVNTDKKPTDSGAKNKNKNIETEEEKERPLVAAVEEIATEVPQLPPQKRADGGRESSFPDRLRKCAEERQDDIVRQYPEICEGNGFIQQVELMVAWYQKKTGVHVGPDPYVNVLRWFQDAEARRKENEKHGSGRRQQNNSSGAGAVDGSQGSYKFNDETTQAFLNRDG